MFGRWIVGVILLFVILIMMLPDTDDQSLSRIGSASMLMCSKDFREAVAGQVKAGRPVTASFTNTCPDLITSLTLSDSGEVVITGNKHPVTMRLKPVIEDGEVRWSCSGEPAADVTNLCKP